MKLFPQNIPAAGISQIWLVCLVILLTLVSVSAGSAKPPKCDVCGKPIVGSGYTVDGKHFHPGCFACAQCGEPLNGKYVKEGGEYYHAQCFVEKFAPRCDHCGEPIVGNYIDINDRVYHDTCYQHNFAPVCKVTGERIMGTVLQNDWGETIAETNRQKVLDCSSCGRFAVLDRSLRLPDGRIVCSICRQSAVTDVNKGRELLRKTAQMLDQAGVPLLVPLHEIQLKLVDKDRLAPLAARIGSGDSYGICKYGFESRKNEIVSESYTIYILSHLSEEAFIGVAAHELFHVWQHAVRADGPSGKWLEGGANLAMYVVLSQLTGPYAEYRRDKLFDDPDPVYGDGFRMVYETYRKGGMERVLKTSLRRNPRPANRPH